MKWGKKNKAEDEKKTKTTNKKSSSPFSSSASVHLSNFFPFLISRLKRPEQGSINPKQSPPTSSAHLLHRTAAGEAPRRRSTGDDDRCREKSDISRSARNYSLDLELRPISSFRPCDDHSPPPTPMKRAAARRRRHRIQPKVKVCSPKVARKRQMRNLESFAVVKSSTDPQKDFKDSMVEMVREKRMRRPEEMERLLSCYINLNADEHHDAIVKAFRQVWFDFEIWGYAGECHCCHCCDCF